MSGYLSNQDTRGPGVLIKPYEEILQIEKKKKKKKYIALTPSWWGQFSHVFRVCLCVETLGDKSHGYLYTQTFFL